MRKLRFYKNEIGWFIDLKWFPFKKDWLQMVSGADVLLDTLAKGKSEITLEVSTRGPIPFSDGMLEKHVSLGVGLGAYYFSREGFNKQDVLMVSSVWLCPATLWVFFKYPEKIYYRIAE